MEHFPLAPTCAVEWESICNAYDISSQLQEPRGDLKPYGLHTCWLLVQENERKWQPWVEENRQERVGQRPYQHQLASEHGAHADVE